MLMKVRRGFLFVYWREKGKRRGGCSMYDTTNRRCLCWSVWGTEECLFRCSARASDHP